MFATICSLKRDHGGWSMRSRDGQNSFASVEIPWKIARLVGRGNRHRDSARALLLFTSRSNSVVESANLIRDLSLGIPGIHFFVDGVGSIKSSEFLIIN
jgi:hypothetical protein